MRRKFSLGRFQPSNGLQISSCSHGGGALRIHAICRPQLFVKDMILGSDTDTWEISISVLAACLPKWLCSALAILYHTKNDTRRGGEFWKYDQISLHKARTAPTPPKKKKGYILKALPHNSAYVCRTRENLQFHAAPHCL